MIKHSGVGVDDALLEENVSSNASRTVPRWLWDVDAPATLADIEEAISFIHFANCYRIRLRFYTTAADQSGQHYLKFRAQVCHPIYNALDPASHYPVAPGEELRCDLVFIGNRLPDRERRVEEFFLAAAELAPRVPILTWQGRLARKAMLECSPIRTRSYS